MGRPPLGKQPLTATERQQRWRLRKRVSQAVLQPIGTTERLKIRVRDLEFERAALRIEIEKLGAQAIRFMRAWAGSWTINKARVHDLETELAAERVRHEAPLDVADMPVTYRKKYEVVRRGLERKFQGRVRQEAHRLLDELFLADVHDALDNVLDGRKPFAPRRTGYH
jgi:hypothetical protein